MRQGEIVFVGTGTWIGALSLEALDEIQSADVVYVEQYTSIAPQLTLERLKRITLGRIKVVKRYDLEDKSGEEILNEAQSGRKVVLLVAGDPFIATTHVTLRIEAEKRGIRTRVVNGLSAITAVISITGLQIYRFGKIATLTYPEEGIYPLSTYYTVRENLERNLHTLLLLDLKLEKGKAMTVSEAAEILLEIEERVCAEEGWTPVLRETIGVGVARAGTPEAKAVAAKIPELREVELPPPPHSLIVVAKPHPVEEEALRYLCGLKEYR